MNEIKGGERVEMAGESRGKGNIRGFKGSRDVGVVRALAFHQCVLGSIPGPGVIRGLSLLLVLFLAPRGFSPGTMVFPLLKNQHFQTPIRSGLLSSTLI